MELSTCENADSAFFFCVCALRTREESPNYLKFYFIIHLRTKRDKNEKDTESIGGTNLSFM